MKEIVFFSLTACLLIGCNMAAQPKLFGSKALNPNPPDRASGVSPDVKLRWTGEPGAIYRVYFGRESPPPFAGEQTETTLQPGPLDFDTTYYWQIDVAGGRKGEIWKFTTFWYGDPNAEEMDI